MHTCMRAHTHTHTHTHTQTHTNTPHMHTHTHSLTQQQQQQPPKHCNTDSACSFARSNEKKLNQHICTGHNLCRWLHAWIPPFPGKLLHKQDQSKEVTSGLINCINCDLWGVCDGKLLHKQKQCHLIWYIVYTMISKGTVMFVTEHL